MKRLIESIKRIPWVMRFYYIIFSWRGKLWVVYRLKVLILSFFDFLKVPKQEWTRKLIWKQILFQRVFRGPEPLARAFTKTLRVCGTYRCNLTCQYCYVRGLEKKFPEDMTIDNFLKLVLWAKNRGWEAIRFLGGEPTIHPYFSEMLDICYKNKMYIQMATNNTFSSQITSKLDRMWVDCISVNYIFDILNNDQKVIFENNLKHFSIKRIPFEFSYVIGYQDNNQLENFLHAERYRPRSIRASIAIPGLSKQTSISEVKNNFRAISSKIFEFQKKCIKLGIPFYIYRPIVPCLFSGEEWQRLKGFFPFMCFTKCPLGLRGDYSSTIVVNPDLSMFPCVAVFNKGPNILSFKDRREISFFYKEKVKLMLKEPLFDLCKNCEQHENFLGSLEKGVKSDLKSCSSKKICQGGCLSFRKNAQSLCCGE